MRFDPAVFNVRTFEYLLDGVFAVGWIVTEPNTWTNCGDKVRIQTESTTEYTYGVCHIDIRGRNLFALFTCFPCFFHIPNT